MRHSIYGFPTIKTMKKPFKSPSGRKSSSGIGAGGSPSAGIKPVISNLPIVGVDRASAMGVDFTIPINVKVPDELKKFIKENPIVTATILNSRYSKKPLQRLKSDLLAAKSYKNNLRGQLNKAIKDYQNAMANIGGGEAKDVPIPEAKVRPFTEKASYVENFIDLLSQYIKIREFEEADQKADQAAVDRGYKDAEDAKAMREVEIEWYYQLYGTEDTIEILAYQRIEKDKYGTTSYEAALAGQELIPKGSIIQEEVRQESAEEADQIRDDVAIYEEEKKAKMKLYLYIGVPVVGVIAYLIYRSRQ
jgi:hypothetical protein